VLFSVRGTDNIHDRRYFPSAIRALTRLALTLTLTLTVILTITITREPAAENSLEQIQLPVPGDGKYNLRTKQSLLLGHVRCRIYFYLLFTFCYNQRSKCMYPFSQKTGHANLAQNIAKC